MSNQEIVQTQMQIVKALAELADSIPGPYEPAITADMINRFGELIEEGMPISQAIDQVRVEKVW